jgi:ABC-type multidrug transport system fused ATPase/permease subunit
MTLYEWQKQGDIEFRGVSLRYRPGTELVLKNVSFWVRAGEKIGIVGRTGAGKSTIAMALSRIVELEEGSIEIDGVNIAQISLKQLRKRITIIP